jgi:hypothetical protein
VIFSEGAQEWLPWNDNPPIGKRQDWTVIQLFSMDSSESEDQEFLIRANCASCGITAEQEATSHDTPSLRQAKVLFALDILSALSEIAGNIHDSLFVHSRADPERFSTHAAQSRGTNSTSHDVQGICDATTSASKRDDSWPIAK